MKDVREKYSGVTDDDELDGEVEIRRQGKKMRHDEDESDVNAMVSSMYEFLYGSESGSDLAEAF